MLSCFAVCSQVRIHCTTDTDFYLRTRSKPIIEHSSGVRFAPFALDEPPMGQDGTSSSTSQPAGASPEEECVRLQLLLKQYRLGEETEMYQQVEDFGWIKASHSPNWALMADCDRMSPVKVPWEKLVRNTISNRIDEASGNGDIDEI